MIEKNQRCDPVDEIVKKPGSRGGQRSGAGRKGQGFESRRVALSLPPAMWQAIDKEKSDSTAEVIRKSLAKVIPCEPEVKPVPLRAIPPINLKAAFYGRSAEYILDWLNQLVPVTDFDRQTHHVSWDAAIQFVAGYYENADVKEILHERILSDFPDKCGIGPSKVEEILSCTKTERKRWEQEGRLLVVDTFNAGSKRNPVWVPMYDRRIIESLTSDVITQWRMDHEAAKALNRRQNEERSEVRTRFVTVEVLQEGKRPYRIFGPVGTEDILAIWTQHKDKLPWDWVGSVVVQMKDVHTDEVLQLEVRSI